MWEDDSEFHEHPLLSGHSADAQNQSSEHRYGSLQADKYSIITFWAYLLVQPIPVVASSRDKVPPVMYKKIHL